MLLENCNCGMTAAPLSWNGDCVYTFFWKVPVVPSTWRNPPGSTVRAESQTAAWARMGNSGVPGQAGPRHGAVNQSVWPPAAFSRVGVRASVPKKTKHVSTKTAFSDNAYRPPADINAGTSKHNRKHKRSGISLTPRAGRSGAT